MIQVIEGKFDELLRYLNTIPWPMEKSPFALAKRHYENDYVLYGESDRHDLDLEKIEKNVRIIMNPTRREFLSIRDYFANRQTEMFEDGS